ncbi:MAG: tRNA-dihydrouridine synthase [Halodesulfurarchaeum sp.]
MFEPRLALSSLSGESDATWAADGEEYAGLAVLGGLAIDESTRRAARTMAAERDREEFLPERPLVFLEEQLVRMKDLDIRPAFNIRATELAHLRKAARRCADAGAILEVNAHCRQAEICAAGAGEALLRSPERLRAQVQTAAEVGATVSVKVRAEVEGVDLPGLSADLAAAGAGIIHVDAMDSEAIVGDVVDATDAFVIANNGVRDRETAHEYLAYGADAVSVGRPSDDPAVLSRVRDAVEGWFG